MKEKTLGVSLNLIKKMFSADLFVTAVLYGSSALEFGLLGAERCSPTVSALPRREEARQAPPGDDSGQVSPSGGVSPPVAEEAKRAQLGNLARQIRSQYSGSVISPAQLFSCWSFRCLMRGTRP